MAKRKFSFFRKSLMFIEAVFLLPFIHIIAFFCPYKFVYPFSKKVGSFLLVLSPNKKKIICKNLNIIFPNNNYTQQEIKEICSIIVGYELRILLEMILFAKMSFQDTIAYIRINQHDQISKMYEAQSKSFVGFTLHYGNWELLGSFVNQLGIPLACLVERQFNPWIDKHLQNLRYKLGIITIYNEISEMKPLFKYMKKGGGIALVADQTYWFDPLFIPFFDKEVAVPQGSASLAIKMNSNLFFGYNQYIGNGMYLIEIDTDVSLANHRDLSHDVENLMKLIYHKYETIIKKDVTNWYTLGTDRWDLTRESLKEWEKNPDSDRF